MFSGCMGRTCRWAGGIELTPVGVKLNGSRRVHWRRKSPSSGAVFVVGVIFFDSVNSPRVYWWGGGRSLDSYSTTHLHVRPGEIELTAAHELLDGFSARPRLCAAGAAAPAPARPSVAATRQVVH